MRCDSRGFLQRAFKYIVKPRITLYEVSERFPLFKEIALTHRARSPKRVLCSFLILQNEIILELNK